MNIEKTFDYSISFSRCFENTSVVYSSDENFFEAIRPETLFVWFDDLDEYIINTCEEIALDDMWKKI